MKLLWLCNMIPGVVRETLNGEASGGLWVDHVLSGIRKLDITVRILFPGNGEAGQVDEKLSFAAFREGLPYVYLPELESGFRSELEDFAPDVIHIWGTEYGHTLAMVNAAQALDMVERVVIHIQGICSVYAQHYAEGVPYRVQHKSTFRDLVRRDNIAQQQKKFALRGELEVQALKKVRHVMGRTDWDEACVKAVNPDIHYHFCNETLRSAFYEARWNYDTCQKHRVFASSCVYPIKGFHYLLEAFAQVKKLYPNAVLAVPGYSYLAGDLNSRLRRNGYQAYLAELTRRYGLEGSIEFLGNLSAAGMKAEYLKANVFVLPSTIENSPNSLGEAMLLGVPCAASDVGGVSTMLTHRKEGMVYQSSAPYMLAHYIKELFAMGDGAAVMGLAAREHALQTHDPEKNLEDLLNVYGNIAK